MERKLKMDAYKILEHNLSVINFNGQRVLLIVPDSTRTAPVAELVAIIYRIIGDDTVCLDILVALGTHPPMSSDALLSHVGISKKSDYPKTSVFNHAWDDPDCLTTIGTLDRIEVRMISAGLLDEDVPITINRRIFDYDQLMVLSPVFPHEIAGFSGGAKYFFPGISGREIIDTTHWLGALTGNVHNIGRVDTPVRRMIHAAARFIKIPVTGICFVTGEGGIEGMYIGDLQESWMGAALLAGSTHIVHTKRRYRRILACAPKMYDDLWTGAKCMYKCESIVEDGGELIIYAPHIDSFSYTHGHIIETIGYHVAEYFTAHMDEMHDIPRAGMAVSVFVTGAGTYRNGMENRRIRVTLASGIPYETCQRAHLGYADPADIKPLKWKDREQDGMLLVENAGETLYLYD